MTVTSDIRTSEQVPDVATAVPADPVAADPVAPRPPAPPRPAAAAASVAGSARRSRRPLTAPVARLTGAGLFAAFAVGVGIQPAPDGHETVLPWWADLISFVTVVMLLAALVTLATGRRVGLWAGLVASLGFLASTIGCPAVDHHAITGWWYGALGIAAGMAALCLGVLAGTRRAVR